MATFIPILIFLLVQKGTLLSLWLFKLYNALDTSILKIIVSDKLFLEIK